ncbi:MAG: AraC family transcriptional regulator [Paracoccaceae bacterium]
MVDIHDTQNDFRVIPLPHFATGGRWRTEAMRSYSQPLLIWFTKGQGRITIAGSTRGYGPHNAVFVPAGTMHGFDMLGQVYGNIVFFPANADLDLPIDPIHLRLRDVALNNELSALIDNIQREASRDMAAQDRAMLHHGGLLSVWLHRQIVAFPESEVASSTTRRLAAAYTSLVERDFHLSKSVADYARELGVTPTHLSRVCNVACGRPASALLSDRIHFEARRLLCETRKPVKDIAEHLGFASAAYFTRAFQKQSGKTPSIFRKTG